MLIWRLANNILPTREVLARRIESQDTCCILCNEPLESVVHLFFKCPVARAILFGCRWSIRADCLNEHCLEDILKVVLDPPLPTKVLHGQCTLQMALTLEAIWNHRNQVAFNDGKTNLITIINILEQRVKEYLPIIHHEAVHWTCPPTGMIKLNVDVAISKSHTTLAVVAWDEKRAIIKAWAKDNPLCEPLNAEVDAILWALQLADAEKFKNIIVEGDSKICFINSLLSESTDVWTITNVLSNILELRKYFDSCIFCWVCREGNTITDSMAKYAAPSRSLSVVICHPSPTMFWMCGSMICLLYPFNEIIFFSKKNTQDNNLIKTQNNQNFFLKQKLLTPENCSTGDANEIGISRLVFLQSGAIAWVDDNFENMWIL